MTGPRRLRRALGALLLGTVTVTGPAVAASATLAMLPAENLTGFEDAAGRVETALAAALVERGWQPVAGEPVERILREERARRGDTLPDRARERLLDELDADGIATVTVLVWRPGRNPIVALSARILGRDGAEASALGALSAAERERAFGLGPPPEIGEVAGRAVAELARSLPAPGQVSPPAGRRHAPLGSGSPVVLRDPAVFAGAPLRVALLPFANDSREPEAPRVLAEVLARRLRASGAFDPVEPAELRAALRAERIPSLRFLDAEAIRSVGRRLETRLFLRGTVWQWREGSPASAGPVPEVELELELVDVESGRVLWAAHHGRRGDDYVGLFLRGRIGTATGLLDQILAEIVTATERSEPVRLAARPAEESP